jgi:hypothetical protein
VPPSRLVFGIGINSAAAHHRGNNINPIKNNHACSGLPPLSSHPLHAQRDSPSCTCEGQDSVHGVLCTGAGFRGSRMWKVLPRVMDGACGEMSADMGMEAWERLRLDGGRFGACWVLELE